MPSCVENSVYCYKPNQIAPAIFAALFAISGCLHFFQTMHYRSWRTTGPMPWAALLLCAGFILREIGSFDIMNIPVFIAESVLMMSGPPVYAGINYLVLSRVLFYVPYLSVIHPGRVLTTFLAMDVVCEILIINGVQKIVDSRFDENTRRLGNALTKSGLILQVVMFGTFMFLAATFHRRAMKAGVCSKKIHRVLVVLYVSTIIVTARCIYRIVEFFEYGQGPLTHSEAYFWVFEAAIMFINTAMLNIFHPGRSLPRSNEVFLARDGKTELRGPGYEDKRPFLVTFVDPFDIAGLVTDRDKKTAFWDWTPEQLQAADEANRRKRALEDARPRAIWKKIVDPLHLFDRKGNIMAVAERMNMSGTSQRGVTETSNNMPSDAEEYSREMPKVEATV